MAGIEYYQPEPQPMESMPEGWKMDDTVFDPDVHLQVGSTPFSGTKPAGTLTERAQFGRVAHGQRAP